MSGPLNPQSTSVEHVQKRVQFSWIDAGVPIFERYSGYIVSAPPRVASNLSLIHI